MPARIWLLVCVITIEINMCLTPVCSIALSFAVYYHTCVLIDVQQLCDIQYSELCSAYCSGIATVETFAVDDFEVI